MVTHPVTGVKEADDRPTETALSLFIAYLAWPSALEDMARATSRECGAAAKPHAQVRMYFGMSPEACVHPHGNPSLLMLLQPDPQPAQRTPTAVDSSLLPSAASLGSAALALPIQ